MRHVPIRAFGLVVLHRVWDKGTRHLEKITPDFPCTTYCVRGRSVSTRLTDGSSVPDFAEGYFANKANYEAGDFELLVVEENETFCYDSRMNGGYHPDISRVEVTAGQDVELPVGAKWLLCRGAGTVGDKKVTGPTQISVKHTSVVFTAQTKCFFMVFP